MVKPAKDGSKLIPASVQVNLTELLNRYSKEFNLQLGLRQPSLQELCGAAEQNWDPVLLCLVAHFFDAMNKEDAENLDADTRAAAHLLQELAAKYSSPEMVLKIVEPMGAQGESIGAVCDLENLSPDDRKRLEQNQQFAKAMKILNEAKAANRPLTRGEILVLFEATTKNVNLPNATIAKILDQMVKRGDITQQARDDIFKQLVNDGGNNPNIEKLTNIMGPNAMVNQEGKVGYKAPKTKVRRKSGGKFYRVVEDRPFERYLQSRPALFHRVVGGAATPQQQHCNVVTAKGRPRKSPSQGKLASKRK